MGPGLFEPLVLSRVVLGDQGGCVWTCWSEVVVMPCLADSIKPYRIKLVVSYSVLLKPFSIYLNLKITQMATKEGKIASLQLDFEP